MNSSVATTTSSADEDEQSVGHGAAQYTSRMNIRLTANRSPHHRLAHRKADHDAGPVSAVAERAGQRLQPEEQPRAAHAARRADGEFVVDGLARRHMVVEKSGFGSRVPKYQQIFCNTEFGSLKFTPAGNRRSSASCCCADRRRRASCAARVPRMAELPDPIGGRGAARGAGDAPRRRAGRAARARAGPARFALGAAVRRAARVRDARTRRRRAGGAARAAAPASVPRSASVGDLAGRVAALEGGSRRAARRARRAEGAAREPARRGRRAPGCS